MNCIEKVKKLIGVINAVHLQYSRDYFDTGVGFEALGRSGYKPQHRKPHTS
ncbi:MAG: hypothetical protein FWD35_02745 [Oscillospiraceae bacterium]|nr:hypothetical protein [Oscillospiraceae bacterium]